MTDETPVERLLRQHVQYRRDHGDSATISDAIDCGREAIRLLDADDFLSVAWYRRRNAWLTKCWESQR